MRAAPVGHHVRPARGRPLPARRERGSVLVVVAISLTVLVACTALTVDLGRISGRRRQLQNVADAAALDLVRLIDGRPASAVTADPRWTATLDASLDRNGFTRGGDASITVAVGSYDPVAEVFTTATGADPPTAVRVVAEDRVEYAFAPGGATTARTGIAAQQAYAGIQLGSYVARLDSSRSPLLDALLGDALGVTAVGYTGLVGARIGLDELAAELDLSLGSPEELLTTDVTLVELVTAQAEVLRRGGDTARADILDAIAAGLTAPDEIVTLGDLVRIVGGGQAAAAEASVEVLDLLTGAAFVANGDAFLDVPAVSLALPGGVLTQTTQVRVIESPRVVFGGVGASVETAQVRLRSTVTARLAGSTTTLTLDVEVAPATATISGIGCATPRTLATDVTTGLASATVDGRADVFVTAPLVGRVQVARADLAAATSRPDEVASVDFTLPPDQVGVPVSVSGSPLDVAGATVTVEDVQVLTVPLGVVVGPLVDGVVSAVAGPLLDQLDAALVQPLLGLLGVSAPGADVAPLGVRCGTPAMVG